MGFSVSGVCDAVDIGQEALVVCDDILKLYLGIVTEADVSVMPAKVVVIVSVS
jgi:hypothetical protein